MSSVPRPVDLTQVPRVPWAWVGEHLCAPSAAATPVEEAFLRTSAGRRMHIVNPLPGEIDIEERARADTPTWFMCFPMSVKRATRNGSALAECRLTGNGVAPQAATWAVRDIAC